MNAQPNRPNRLIVICGLCYAGKTTLGNAIVDRFKYPRVDVDKTKTEIFGPNIQDRELNQEQWNHIYEMTDSQVRRILMSGQNVLDDSRYFRKAERDRARATASGSKGIAVVIYVDTPLAIVRERWIANRNKPTRHDIGDEVFQEIITIFEPPGPDENAIVFNHGDNIDNWITSHCSHLT